MIRTFRLLSCRIRASTAVFLVSRDQPTGWSTGCRPELPAVAEASPSLSSPGLQWTSSSSEVQNFNEKATKVLLWAGLKSFRFVEARFYWKDFAKQSTFAPLLVRKTKFVWVHEFSCTRISVLWSHWIGLGIWPHCTSWLFAESQIKHPWRKYSTPNHRTQPRAFNITTRPLGFLPSRIVTPENVEFRTLFPKNWYSLLQPNSHYLAESHAMSFVFVWQIPQQITFFPCLLENLNFQAWQRASEKESRVRKIFNRLLGLNSKQTRICASGKYCSAWNPNIGSKETKNKLHLRFGKTPGTPASLSSCCSLEPVFFLWVCLSESGVLSHTTHDKFMGLFPSREIIFCVLAIERAWAFLKQ